MGTQTAPSNKLLASWIIVILSPLLVQGVVRTFELNEALNLDCSGSSENQKRLYIERVSLATKVPSYCSYSLRSEDVDYQRIVTECSGKIKCRNIIIRNTKRIQCGLDDARDSQMLSVEYRCIRDTSIMNICSPSSGVNRVFNGFLMNPGYSPSDTEEQPAVGSICQCDISTVSQNAKIVLKLMDVSQSDMLTVQNNTGGSRAMCNSDRCINVNMYTASNRVRITYNITNSELTRMFLKYSANTNGSAGYVKSRCQLITPNSELTSSTLTETSQEQTTLQTEVNNVEKKEFEKLEEEIFSLEVIIGIAIGASILLIVIIIIIIFCRRRVSSGSSSNSSGPLKYIPQIQNSKAVYDCVPHEGGCGTDDSQRRLTRSTVENHIYCEPHNPVSSSSDQEEARLYYAPCSNDTLSECSDNEGSLNDPIYESVSNLNEIPAHHRISRNSRMSKINSMPQHPAPPRPRQPTTVRTRIEDKPNHYDIPNKSPIDNLSDNHSLVDSMGSIPHLDIDFSDLTQRFGHAAENNEYLQPNQPRQIVTES